MKKVLFFDIDGTLLSHRTLTIPESAKRAVRKAKENGHLIFINTGRTGQKSSFCQARSLRSMRQRQTKMERWYMTKMEIRCQMIQRK